MSTEKYKKTRKKSRENEIFYFNDVLMIDLQRKKRKSLIKREKN
jgi:hypothetical protein